MNNQIKHPLEGTWFSPEWSSVEIKVKKLKTTMQIKAIDTEDQEKLLIRNKQWDENSISFDLFTPSTDHTCHHMLKDKGNGEAFCQITYIENWVLKEN